MHQIKYGVDIKYRDFDNEVYSISYKVFAENEENAKTIAEELFFMNYGVSQDMSINVHIELPSDKELQYINRNLINNFGVIKKSFSNLSYKAFLNSIENFDGYDICLEPNKASFRFQFLDYTCLAHYENGVSYVDENEVYFLYNNRTYLITNSLCDIYISKLII